MNHVVAKVKKNTYKDSMQLMQLTESAKKLKGVIDAAAVMGTENNKELLRSVGLMTPEGEDADSDDILLIVSALSREEAEDALEEMEKFVFSGKPVEGSINYYELEEALKMDDVNFSVVSVPGEIAKEVVLPILERGVSVHLFSDHVSLEDEIHLKKVASSKGLLLLGPSAGTSIIGGKGIAFANSVSRGKVGIISASGTGLQEVSVLLTAFGDGVSQGFGVGGRDLSDPCMGMMTKSCIKILEEDKETDVICIISKPAGENALASLIEFIKNETKKQFVLCLLGSRELKISGNRIVQAYSLHKAAALSINALGKNVFVSSSAEELMNVASEVRGRLSKERHYLRGVFTGGTLAYEAMLILQEGLGRVYSNVPLKDEDRLKNPFTSYQNTVIDMGEEEFTEGRLHPMIDPSFRKLRLKQEMNDPSVALLLVDVILGFGSNSDPAGGVTDALQEFKVKDDMPAILAHLCGTEKDPQVLSKQAAKLREYGVHIFQTNAEMSFVAVQALNGNDRDIGKRLARKYLAE